MKIVACEQGSVTWMMARLGLPTASCFDKLLTPSKHQPSESVHDYRAQLTGEWILKQPADWGSNEWTERGTRQEEKARNYYAYRRGVKVQEVGFILRDDGEVGCSPDGLVGSDGGIEIKCLGIKKFMRYVLGVDDLAKDFFGQVQGCMYLAERAWWDVVAYNDELPHLTVIQRVGLDEGYVGKLVPVLAELVENLKADRERFANDRVERPWDG